MIPDSDVHVCHGTTVTVTGKFRHICHDDVPFCFILSRSRWSGFQMYESSLAAALALTWRTRTRNDSDIEGIYCSFKFSSSRRGGPRPRPYDRRSSADFRAAFQVTSSSIADSDPCPGTVTARPPGLRGISGHPGPAGPLALAPGPRLPLALAHSESGWQPQDSDSE